MRIKPFTFVIMLVLSALILTACNIPKRQAASSPTAPASILAQPSPTPASLCANPYFPNTQGDQWEYSGTNSLVGDYTRTDIISNSSTQTFIQETTLAGVTYSVPYDCTTAGLVSQNPVQQYAGALLSSPDSPVEVKLSSNNGISLPAKVNPGDTWQQTADFEATSKQLNVNGRFVFEYTAVGNESITVQAGTYTALRVDGTIRIEVTGLHILAGTYTTTNWWVPGIGLVKSEGTSQVPNIDFTDSMQLTRFTSAP